MALKTCIRNADGHILLLREKGGEWGLPGGGLEHGEDIPGALARELQEELGITKLLAWLIYRTEIVLPTDLTGELAAGVAFIDISTF